MKVINAMKALDASGDSSLILAGRPHAARSAGMFLGNTNKPPLVASESQVKARLPRKSLTCDAFLQRSTPPVLKPTARSTLSHVFESMPGPMFNESLNGQNSSAPSPPVLRYELVEL